MDGRLLAAMKSEEKTSEDAAGAIPEYILSDGG